MGQPARANTLPIHVEVLIVAAGLKSGLPPVVAALDALGQAP